LLGTVKLVFEKEWKGNVRKHNWLKDVIPYVRLELLLMGGIMANVFANVTAHVRMVL